MSEKTDGNWSFLSDDENDVFEEAPFDSVPPEATEYPSTASAVEPVINSDVPSESSAKVNPVEEKDQSNSQDMDNAAKEAEKRAIHDATEAQRKAEFDARQAAKKKAEAEQIANIQNMSDEEIIAAAIQRAAADTEKITRRNMMEMVTEYIQTLGIEDPDFARLTMHPRKSMIKCFLYIKRKAYEYVQEEIKVIGLTKQAGIQMYAADIPEDLCYKWAEDYFRDPNVKEDQEEEEKFVPKAYAGKTSASSKSKKESPKKKDVKNPGTAKSTEKPVKPTKDEQAAENGQISIFGGL